MESIYANVVVDFLRGNELKQVEVFLDSRGEILFMIWMSENRRARVDELSNEELRKLFRETERVMVMTEMFSKTEQCNGEELKWRIANGRD